MTDSKARNERNRKRRARKRRDRFIARQAHGEGSRTAKAIAEGGALLDEQRRADAAEDRRAAVRGRPAPADVPPVIFRAGLPTLGKRGR